MAGTGEPAYTRSAQNTHWVGWDAVSGADEYRLKSGFYANNALTTEIRTPASPAGGTNFWANWSGVANLEHGSQYGVCVTGEYSLPNDSLFFPDGPNSCTRGTQDGKRSATTIDRSIPAISPVLAGGAAATKSTQVPLSVGYQDDVSPPFPGNFLCVRPGDSEQAACGSAIYGFSPQCSNPAAASKSTSFACQLDLAGAGVPDGPVQGMRDRRGLVDPGQPLGPQPDRQRRAGQPFHQDL